MITAKLLELKLTENASGISNNRLEIVTYQRAACGDQQASHEHLSKGPAIKLKEGDLEPIKKISMTELVGDGTQVELDFHTKMMDTDKRFNGKDESGSKSSRMSFIRSGKGSEGHCVPVSLENRKGKVKAKARVITEVSWVGKEW